MKTALVLVCVTMMTAINAQSNISKPVVSLNKKPVQKTWQRPPEERRKLSLFPKTVKKYVVTPKPIMKNEDTGLPTKRPIMRKFVIQDKNEKGSWYFAPRKPLMKAKVFTIAPDTDDSHQNNQPLTPKPYEPKSRSSSLNKNRQSFDKNNNTKLSINGTESKKSDFNLALNAKLQNLPMNKVSTVKPVIKATTIMSNISEQVNMTDQNHSLGDEDFNLSSFKPDIDERSLFDDSSEDTFENINDEEPVLESKLVKVIQNVDNNNNEHGTPIVSDVNTSNENSTSHTINNYQSNNTLRYYENKEENATLSNDNIESRSDFLGDPVNGLVINGMTIFVPDSHSEQILVPGNIQVSDHIIQDTVVPDSNLLSLLIGLENIGDQSSRSETMKMDDLLSYIHTVEASTEVYKSNSNIEMIGNTNENIAQDYLFVTGEASNSDPSSALVIESDGFPETYFTNHNNEEEPTQIFVDPYQDLTGKNDIFGPDIKSNLSEVSVNLSSDDQFPIEVNDDDFLIFDVISNESLVDLSNNFTEEASSKSANNFTNGVIIPLDISNESPFDVAENLSKEEISAEAIKDIPNNLTTEEISDESKIDHSSDEKKSNEPKFSGSSDLINNNLSKDTVDRSYILSREEVVNYTTISGVNSINVNNKSISSDDDFLHETVTERYHNLTEEILEKDVTEVDTLNKSTTVLLKNITGGEIFDEFIGWNSGNFNKSENVFQKLNDDKSEYDLLEEESIKEFVTEDPINLNEEIFLSEDSQNRFKRSINIIEEESFGTTLSGYRYTGKETHIKDDLTYKNINA